MNTTPPDAEPDLTVTVAAVDVETPVIPESTITSPFLKYSTIVGAGTVTVAACDIGTIEELVLPNVIFK